MPVSISLDKVKDYKSEAVHNSRRRAQVDPDDLVLYIDMAACGLGFADLRADLGFVARDGFDPEMLEGRVGTIASMNVLTQRSPEAPDVIRGAYQWCIYEVRDPRNVRGLTMAGEVFEYKIES